MRKPSVSHEPVRCHAPTLVGQTILLDGGFGAASLTPIFDPLEESDDGYWRLSEHAESVLLMFSIRAHRPE